jgi:phosphate transport system permease protein
MNVVPSTPAAAAPRRSDRFHLWRSRKDAVVRWLIAIGGIGVIGAVVLIFFYLLWVVFPLFMPASSHMGEPRAMPGWAETEPVFLAVEEQREVGLRLTEDGRVTFFHIADGATVLEERLPMNDGARIVAVADSVEHNGRVAVATNDGGVYVFQHEYPMTFSGGVETRQITPELSYPYGEESLLELPFPAVYDLAFSDGERDVVIAAIGAGGRVKFTLATKAENFLTGEVTLEPDTRQTEVSFNPTAVTVSGNHRWLYLGDNTGRIHSFSLPALELRGDVHASEGGITAMTMLLGGISVLAGDSAGGVAQLFPVRDENNRFDLRLIRTFKASGSPVQQIVTEQRRKGFLTLDEAQKVTVYHSTAGQEVLQRELAGFQPRTMALAPRANGLLIEGVDGSARFLELHNEHPEVSFSSLWGKVWYENYEEPQYVWQSSASTNEFEPKFSLTPLVFGTIKAAFYAMLFAIPLALMGAAYTAYFMSPELRKWVKPGIEIMAALPTVILGFLAGLWFAPWVEENLMDLLLMLLIIPPGLTAVAWLWHRLHLGDRLNMPEGWEPLLLAPAIIGLGFLAAALAEPTQLALFGGDLRDWLSHEVGIDYDQRNALVVGCAMGFAVIPTIFSIAEDAVFGVPKSLSNGSLALGATPWQTLVYVVLPTASPGIFSGLMIGLGRAVGETMIVLMATGNTPVMDWNLFEGMRTLAANIAVEMPESEVNSSHYRILFLAALVLFLFTFVVNTGAELIRQRLREKYSSL